MVSASGCCKDGLQPVHDEHDVEHEIDGDEDDRHHDGVAETLQEDDAQDEEQQHRDQHRMSQPRGGERVLDEVCRGVGSRQRDGDHETGGGKAQQTQDDDLALPSRQQILEHQDAALAVGAHLRDAVVHGQGAEEREQHEDERRDRRQGAGGDERDARLIGERREIVHAGETHDLPPGGRVGRPDVRSDRPVVSFVQPVVDAPREGADQSCATSVTQHAGTYYSARVASAADAASISPRGATGAVRLTSASSSAIAVAPLSLYRLNSARRTAIASIACSMAAGGMPKLLAMMANTSGSPSALRT